MGRIVVEGLSDDELLALYEEMNQLESVEDEVLCDLEEELSRRGLFEYDEEFVGEEEYEYYDEEDEEPYYKPKDDDEDDGGLIDDDDWWFFYGPGSDDYEGE